MDYKTALKQAKRVGAARSQGDAYLAQNCSLLPLHIGPGINPEAVFMAAQAQGIEPRALLKMTSQEVQDLMFAGLDLMFPESVGHVTQTGQQKL